MSFSGWFVGASEFSDDVIHDTSLGNGLILAGAGNDVVYGNAGDDHLRGESGNDTLYGGNGNDGIFGSEGNDALYGGNGNDWLDGGSADVAGWDGLYGGEGSDTYVISDRSGNTYMNELSATSGGDRILFRDISIWDLTAHWFDDGNGIRRVELFDNDGDTFHIYLPGAIETFEFEVDGRSFADLRAGGTNDWIDNVTGLDGNDLFFLGGGDDVAHRSLGLFG